MCTHTHTHTCTHAYAHTQARAKKAGLSIEDQKAAEKARREFGKVAVSSKRDLEEQQVY